MNVSRDPAWREEALRITGEEFAQILKERARGPGHSGHLDPGLCERAMHLILAGKATPVQIGGFLLVGRAIGDSAAELAAYARALRAWTRTIEVPPAPPTVAVAGGFDGKLRTFNLGAAASIVAAAAGGRMLLVGCENTPPKCGRTVFDALRNLGIPSPDDLGEARRSLTERGFAATTPDHYLPELHALLKLRREMARRTVLSVAEKMVSPVPGSRFLVGFTHRRPFLETLPDALVKLGVKHALVVQTIEGSDEAPLDGSSVVVRVRSGNREEMLISPESLGLGRATKAHIPWEGAGKERAHLMAALEGRGSPARDLLIYNAALRLWVAGEDAPLIEHVERARDALDSGAALALVGELRRLAPACR